MKKDLKKAEVIEVLADIINDKADKHQEYFFCQAETNPAVADAHKNLMLAYSCMAYEMQQKGFVTDGTWLILCFLKKKYQERHVEGTERIVWDNPFSEKGIQAFYDKALNSF